MDSKICGIRHTEKSIDVFYNKYRECKPFNNKRSLKRYYEKKRKISNQKKLFYEKNRDKLLQKQNDRYIHFEELLKNYVEIGNRQKTLEKSNQN